ncbi:Serine/threonine-protein kinase ppk4 [Penicillium atrosanguineum]|uniref:Serine/threonine-protein kinase ppk4 n=1 Tax=Penicillium atrosanguineum TaxID=1132637 RepID=UPI00239FD960|nr:Serine/threonine-protein kinase ppk4 [Penicillium atrosanguineum]KAJ5290749.1 Serine/threonine-protein kinase ppk4 [Penicillium atrosanguineum]
MKAAKVLFCASLLSVALAQSSAAQYDAVCPGKVAEEEISPGLTVRYTCDTLGDYDLSSRVKGSTIKQCAELCKAAAQCTGSTWDRDSSYCYLSGSSKGKARTGSIFMEEVEEEDPFPVEDEDEDPFPEETCEEAKERLEAEVAQLE